MRKKKEFKNVKTDLQTYEKITHIAKLLGKSKAQTVREVFEALFDKVEGLETANVKILKHPMRRIVIFEFCGREKLYLDKLLTIKGKVRNHE